MNAAVICLLALAVFAFGYFVQGSSANQMLGGLSLIVVTVWLYRSGKPWGYAAIPMAIVLVVAASALIHQVVRARSQGNLLLVVVGAALLALELWIVVEGVLAVRRGRAGESTQRATEPVA